MTRLSDYMLNCMKAWQASTGVTLHVVRYRVDATAPFQFDTNQNGMHFYEREDLDRTSLMALARDVNPSLILCFGWMDKDYLNVVRYRTSSCTSVMTMDNQWLGTFRQGLGLVWSRFFVRPIFDHVWVPGPRQRKFAQKLGFKDGRIHEGLYAANAENFDPIWQGLDGTPPAKRLIFAGRYAREKGIEVLWDAFSTYCARSGSNIELWCIGHGPLEPTKSTHPQIRHLGFVQPDDLASLLAGGGIFVLPSLFEPWGLVVHEFALAGCPLVLSRHVGAADWFLGLENGFLVQKVNAESLIAAIRSVDQLTDEELKTMSKSSRRKAMKLTIHDWVRQADTFAEWTA